MLDDWCAEEGRDPGAIERSVGVNVAKIDLADAYLEAGVTQFTIAMSGPEYHLEQLQPWLDLRDERNR